MPTLTWSDTASRLATPTNYWIATTGVDGAPHTVPIWGAVDEEVFYFYSSRATVKARNIAADPRVIIHLESASEVLIVHGVADDLGTAHGLDAVVAAFEAKYTDPDDQALLPGHDDTYDVIWALRPTKALTWSLADMDSTMSRWTAE